MNRRTPKLTVFLIVLSSLGIASSHAVVLDTESDRLLALVRAVWGTQISAVQRLQVEWELRQISDGQVISSVYRGREVWDGAKRYRTGYRGSDIGRGLFVDFAGEAAWDGTVSSSRVTLSPTLRISNDSSALDEAGVGGPFELLEPARSLVSVPRFTIFESRPVKRTVTARRNPEQPHIILVDGTGPNNGKISYQFDLSRGGWPIEWSWHDTTANFKDRCVITNFKRVESQGNVLWLPLAVEKHDQFMMPDGKLAESSMIYTFDESTLLVNDSLTWSVPFRLLPTERESVWDKRAGAGAPTTRRGTVSGTPGWGYQEMERINTEFWKRNPRPTTQVTSTQPDSGKSTAVSEPTQWMWLIALGAGILLVALGIVIKVRRASV